MCHVAVNIHIIFLNGYILPGIISKGECSWKSALMR